MPLAASGQGDLHLIKLAVGAEDVDAVARWQAARRRELGRVLHRTRMMPRRRDELLAGGSIYWVIKGQVRARQCIVGIESVIDGEGRRQTLLELDPQLVPTQKCPCRAFQGWRYLALGEAPPDLAARASDTADLPEALATELRELGIL